MNHFGCSPQFSSDNFLPLNVEENACFNFKLDGPFSSFNLSPYPNLRNSGTYLNYPSKNELDNMGKPSGSPCLSKAAKKRFNRLLREGIPYNEAKILARNPPSTGPSTSKAQHGKSLFQNPKHNGNGPLNDFQNYIQFRMENAGLVPRNTQNPSGMTMSSLFSEPYYRPKKKKRKKPTNVSNAVKLLPNQNQSPGVKSMSQIERKRAKNARRKLRLKIRKISQINKPVSLEAPVVTINHTVTPVEENQKISQTSENIKTEVQIPEEVEKKETAIEISLGIIPFDYPLTSFSQEQLNAIQKDILAKVALQKTEAVKPRFKGVKSENGVMTIQCADEQSAFWLKSIENSLSLQTQIKLKIVDKILKISTAIGYFPGSKEDSTEFILELISGQNEDLKVDEWKVTDRKEEEENSVLTILVDEDSAEKLKSKESINFKFGFAKFVLDLTKVVSLEQDTPKSDTVV